MKCLIITGGIAPEKNILDTHLKNADLVICVDGAADLLCKLNIVPDVLIGDFDTSDLICVKELEAGGAAIKRLQIEKEETDTEAAVDYALCANADEIVILGALGNRIDHSMSNIMMLVRADMAGAKCRIIDKYNVLCVSDKEICVAGDAGQTVSIIPLTGEIYVSATGLKYPLKNLKLEWGSSRGISNIMTGSHAAISISGGYALIVRITGKA